MRNRNLTVKVSNEEKAPRRRTLRQQRSKPQTYTAQLQDELLIMDNSFIESQLRLEADAREALPYVSFPKSMLIMKMLICYLVR